MRAIQGGCTPPSHPTAPVQPFLKWQPGLCIEERHSNELDNSGGAAPPLHPPALAQFAQSLILSVYTALCHVQAIQVECNPAELLL